MANKVQVTFDFKANLGNVKSQMNQLQQMVNQVNKSSHINFGMDTNTFATFKTNLNELSMHMKKAFDPNTGSMNFAALNRSISQSGKTLGQYGRELIQTGRMGEQAFTQMASAIMSSNAPMMKTSAALTKLWGTFKNTVRWQISSSVLMGFTSTIQQGVQYAKDLNKSLNDIQVVTGKTNEQMKKVEQTASRMAKELKSSTLEITKAQLIYYQQGDAAALASKKAEITTKAAAVAFNSSAQQMSEYLTAIWNSYQVGESQLESFVDKLAAIGATTATSMEEIATAMQKVAATANSVGVTFDQLNATIATISSATRVGAEQVGTALKTIYARIGDLKIGADEDGMGLGQVSSQLNAMGIRILDAQNNLRDMGTIVEEIGNKWQTWTDAQQAAVAQAVAGKRQYTQLFALFDNWDDYQMSLLTSQTATGTLETQFETWGTSWEAASNRVKQSAETIYSSLFEDEAFIDMTNILADFLNGVGNVVKGLGGMGGALSVLGAVFMTVFQGQIYGALTNFFTNVSLAKQSLVDLAIVGARRAANGLKDSQSAVDSTNTKVGIFTKTVNALSDALSRIGNKKTSLETTLGGISAALQGQDLRTEEGKSLARSVAIQQAKTKAESSGPMSPMRQEMLEQQVGEADLKNKALYDARVRYKEASNLHFTEGSLAGDAARKSFEALKSNPLNDKAQSQYREDRTRELRASMGFGENVADQQKFRETLKTRSNKLQEKIIQETQKSAPNVKNLQKLKKEFESVQGTLNQYDGANRQANNEINKLAKGYEEVSKASKDYLGALGKIGKFDSNSMKDVASGLASVTQGFGSAAMGASMLINGVKGLFQTINDESMSATDKLGAILSSLASIGMALPMLSSGWKVMGQGMKTLNSVKIGGGAAKAATQVADKAADAKENATKAKEITTQEKNTAMLAANNQALDRNTVAESTDGNTPNLNNSGKKKLNLSKKNPTKGKSFVQTGGKTLSGTDSGAGAGGAGGGAASGASAGTSVGAILGVAAITIAAAVAAWKIVDYTQKESERSAQKAAEALKMQQEAYNQTKSEYEEFTASADRLNDINTKMSSMTQGTTEFTDALLQANDEVVNLISKYPELAKYTEILDDGRMSISQEGLELAKKQQQTALRKQQAATMNSTIISQNATSDARAEKLAKDTSKRDEAAIGTAMGMAAAGAIAGSFIPVVGNIVGALIGGAAGLIGGVATAATINPSDDFEKLVDEIQKNGLDVMDDNVRLAELTGKTIDEVVKLKPDLMKLANEVNANSIATKQLTKEMIGANNEDKLKDRTVNEQNAIKNFFADQASSTEVDKEVKEKYTNHGLAALFSGGNNDKAINEDWVKMMISQSEGTGITDYKVTEGAGDTVQIQYFKDGQWIKEEGTRSQKQMAEEVARYNLTTLTDENLINFEKERDKIANALYEEGALNSGIVDIANQLLSGEQVDMSGLSKEQLQSIEDGIANSTLFSKDQRINLAKAIGNYATDVEEANNSAVVSFNRSSAKLADIVTSFRSVIEDINELDRIDTDSISKIKDAALKAGMDETTWASYEDRLWLNSGNKQEISNIMGDIIRSQFSSTLSNVNLIGNKDQGINSKTVEERMTILTNQLKSAGVQNASAVAKATITNKILQEMLEKGYDDTQIANFLKNNGYDYSEAELFDKKLGAFAKGLATGTVKSETLTQEIKDMTSGLKNASDALQIFSAKLLATDTANKYFAFDENGNIRTRLKSSANADVYTDAEGNVLNIADWDTKAETVKNAYDEETYQQIVKDGQITQKYEELLGLNKTGVSKTWTNNMDYLEAQSEIFMKQQLLNNTAEDYQIGPTPEEIEKYNKEHKKQLKEIAEKEEDFIEDMAEAWEEEYSESLKETLEKTFNYLEEYQKKVEGLDFGIELAGDTDYELKGTLLQNKLATLTEYGVTMKQEFSDLANTIPQTAEAAQEVASRIEELGTNMRSNITDIRETQVEIQKLKIASISEWASNRGEALNKELAALEKRIDMLKQDSHSNNFKYSNQILRLSLLTLDREGDKYEKQINDKRKADKEIIAEEQQTQETINAIVSRAIDMQNAENAKKRQEEREDLIKDYEKTMADLKEELTELDKEFNNKFSAMTDSVSSLTAEINQLKEATKDIPVNFNVSYNTINSLTDAQEKDKIIQAVDSTLEDGKHTATDKYEKQQEILGNFNQFSTQEIVSAIKQNRDSGNIEVAEALNKAMLNRGELYLELLDIASVDSMPKGYKVFDTDLRDVNFEGNDDDYIYWDYMKEVMGKEYSETLQNEILNASAHSTTFSDKDGKKRSLKVISKKKLKKYIKETFKNSTVEEYAEGTSNHPGGLALVGDEKKGAYEVAVLPDGTIKVLGKEKAELVNLPEGTVVIPHDESKDILSKTGNIDGQKVPKYKDGAGEISSIPTLALGEDPGYTKLDQDTKETTKNITKTFEKTDKTVKKDIEKTVSEVDKTLDKEVTDIKADHKKLTTDLSTEFTNQENAFDTRGNNMVSDNKLDMEEIYLDTVGFISATIEYAKQNPINIKTTYDIEENYIPDPDNPLYLKESYNSNVDFQEAINALVYNTVGKTNDFGSSKYKTNISKDFSRGIGKTDDKTQEWCADFVSYFLLDLADRFDKTAKVRNTADGQLTAFQWNSGVKGLREQAGVSTAPSDIEKLTLLYQGTKHVGLITDISYDPSGENIKSIVVIEGNTGNTTNYLSKVKTTSYASIKDLKAVWPEWSIDPVKFYATGTKGHPGGPAVVGDQFKGAYEAVISPDGKMSVLGENNAMMMDLPEGTQVIPHDETKKILDSGMKIPMYSKGIADRFLAPDMVKALMSAAGVDAQTIKFYEQGDLYKNIRNLSVEEAKKHSDWQTIVGTLNPFAGPKNLYIVEGETLEEAVKKMNGLTDPEKAIQLSQTTDKYLTSGKNPDIHTSSGQTYIKQSTTPYDLRYATAYGKSLGAGAFPTISDEETASLLWSTLNGIQTIANSAESFAKGINSDEWKRDILHTKMAPYIQVLDGLGFDKNFFLNNDGDFILANIEKIADVLTKIKDHVSLIDIDEVSAKAASHEIVKNKGYEKFVGMSDLNAHEVGYAANELLYNINLFKNNSRFTDENAKNPAFWTENEAKYLNSINEGYAAGLLGNIVTHASALGLNLSDIFANGVEKAIPTLTEFTTKILAVTDNTFKDKYSDDYKLAAKDKSKDDWLASAESFTNQGKSIKISKTREEIESYKKATDPSSTAKEIVDSTAEYTKAVANRKADEEMLIATQIENEYYDYLKMVDEGYATWDIEIINAFETAIADSVERLNGYNETIQKADQTIIDFYDSLEEHNNKIISLNNILIDRYNDTKLYRPSGKLVDLGQLIYENMSLEKDNMTIAHDKAERLRELKYDEDSPEIIAAKTAYMEADKRYADYTEQMVNYITKALEKEKNDMISKIEGDKEFLTISFEFETNLKEVEKELNDLLTESLTQAAYLDSDTRKLIFNEEDFVALNNELKNIRGQFTKIKKEFNDKLYTAKMNNDIDQVKHITEQYKLQTDLLMSQFEIKKAELEVSKKRLELENVLNERNVQMFINGRWQWVADQKAVIEAQKALNDAEFEKEQKEDENKYNKSINANDKIISDINYKFDSAMTKLDGAVTTSTQYLSTFGSMLDTVTKGVLTDLHTGLHGSKASERIEETKYKDNTLYGQDKIIPNSVVDAAQKLGAAINVLRSGETDPTKLRVARQQVQTYGSKLSEKGYGGLANTLATMTDPQRKEFLNSLIYGSKDYTDYYDPTGKAKLSDWFYNMTNKDKTSYQLGVEQSDEANKNKSENEQKISNSQKTLQGQFINFNGGAFSDYVLGLLTKIVELKGQYESATTQKDKDWIANANTKEFRGLDSYFGEAFQYAEKNGLDSLYKMIAYISTLSAADATTFIADLPSKETLIQKIVENKGLWEEANAAGNMTKTEEIAKQTQGYYDALETLGENPIVDALKSANYENAKKILNGEITVEEFLAQGAVENEDENTQKIIDNATDNAEKIVEATEKINNNNNNNVDNNNTSTGGGGGATGDSDATAKLIEQGMPLWLAGKAATGTRSALTGLYQINEIGEETFVTPDGHFRNFAGGEVVFTHEQSQRLFSLLNADLFDTGKGIGNVGNFEQSNSNDTYINIGGISVDTTSQDGKDLVEILQRITNI